ncbi:twin-arginine translocation signal domain-containing protein, partial [Streptomyces sp. SID4931]
MRITRTPRTAPTTRRTLLRASAATAAAGVLAAGSSPVGAA